MRGPIGETQPLIGLKAGYVKRAWISFPSKDQKSPWILRQNYLLDMLSLHFGAVDDGALVFLKVAETQCKALQTCPSPKGRSKIAQGG